MSEALLDLVGRIARSIAHSHYDRKAWYGWCAKAERTRYLVDTYWAQFVPDALAVIATILPAEQDRPSLEQVTAYYKKYSLQVVL